MSIYIRGYFLIGVSFLFLSTGCNSQEEAASQKAHEPTIDSSRPITASDLQSVDELIESELKESGTPGAALVIVRDGKILHARGYGQADVESRLAADVNTVWPLASITKVLTSIAVMQLVESGKIRLERDVNTYLKRVRVPDTFSSPITVADLLRHTSGLDAS